MANTAEVLADKTKDPITPEATDRELDVRNSDGIHVQLFHRPNSVPPLLYVTVSDIRNETAYDPIRVPSPSEAYEVFHHAMSYLSEEATRAAFSQEMAIEDA